MRTLFLSTAIATLAATATGQAPGDPAERREFDHRANAPLFQSPRDARDIYVDHLDSVEFYVLAIMHRKNVVYAREEEDMAVTSFLDDWEVVEAALAGRGLVAVAEPASLIRLARADQRDAEQARWARLPAFLLSDGQQRTVDVSTFTLTADEILHQVCRDAGVGLELSDDAATQRVLTCHVRGECWSDVVLAVVKSVGLVATFDGKVVKVFPPEPQVEEEPVAITTPAEAPASPPPPPPAPQDQPTAAAPLETRTRWRAVLLLALSAAALSVLVRPRRPRAQRSSA